MKKLRKNKKGFTLVELVVVIAILAILASTATVATIAILNNARKTPVSDAANSLKTQMQYYVTLPDSDYAASLGNDDTTGFRKFMKEQMPDITVDTATGTDVTAVTDDNIHVKLSKSDNLKSSEWSCTVYTKYYKCTLTYKWDKTNKAFGKLEIGDVVKV